MTSARLYRITRVCSGVIVSTHMQCYGIIHRVQVSIISVSTQIGSKSAATRSMPTLYVCYTTIAATISKMLRFTTFLTTQYTLLCRMSSIIGPKNWKIRNVSTSYETDSDKIFRIAKRMLWLKNPCPCPNC